MSRNSVIVTVLQSLALFVYGCESLDDYSSNTRRARPVPASQNTDNAIMVGERNDVGIAYEPESSEPLPRNAHRVGEKRSFGNRPDTGLYFQPLRDGRVYVYDADSRRVLVSTHIDAGEK